MPTPAIPLITLITDFGLQDHYVGVMKGVMLGINPKLQLVDICHQVQSHSVPEAAYTLEAAYSYFPLGTIHLIVVDPGVGSRRRPILAQCGDYYFIAPDNGVLSLIWRREKPATVIELTSPRYFLPNISTTFHGRDIFAPAAAWLSRGIKPQQLGHEIGDYLVLNLPIAKLSEPGILTGQIVQVDKFGNLISNISAEMFKQAQQKWGKAFRLQLGNTQIERLIEYYAQAEENEACVIVGSSGRLEIVVREQRADTFLDIGVGQELRLVFNS
jgi:hypothetical protein